MENNRLGIVKQKTMRGNKGNPKLNTSQENGDIA